MLPESVNCDAGRRGESKHCCEQGHRTGDRLRAARDRHGRRCPAALNVRLPLPVSV